MQTVRIETFMVCFLILLQCGLYEIDPEYSF